MGIGGKLQRQNAPACNALGDICGMRHERASARTPECLCMRPSLLYLQRDENDRSIVTFFPSHHSFPSLSPSLSLSLSLFSPIRTTAESQLFVRYHRVLSCTVFIPLFQPFYHQSTNYNRGSSYILSLPICHTLPLVFTALDITPS